ncbi:metabolite/H+ symporter, major facilitator superfamily [Burkholderia sp. YI23]|nr:metabolite/H+ symporter, major facilitator superfamily [Burkholderia sp. YI23]
MRSGGTRSCQETWIPLLVSGGQSVDDDAPVRGTQPPELQIYPVLFPCVRSRKIRLPATTSFYLITVYAPTFGKTVLHLSTADSLLVTLCVGVSNFIWLPIGGALSDRIGRRPLLLSMTILAIVTAYPALSMLAHAPSFINMLLVLLWLSFMYGMYNGAMVVALTEVMPVEVRVAGFSLAYSLATAVFGGFTPAISTALIHMTGDKAAPGYWMSFAAVCALGATLALYRRRPAALRSA